MAETQKKNLSIGELAKQTNLSADTLRYYEKIKLLKADARSKAGYRVYHSDAVRVVRFIQGAKALNFTLDEIRQLLELNTSNQTTCADILKRTESKIVEAEAKIIELQEIKKVLKQLVGRCPGDDTSITDCPILDHLRGTVSKCCSAIIVCMVIGAASVADAKPISYVGGTMVMQENDETGNTLSVDYTFDPHFAVGLYAKQERGGKEFATFGPQLNSLIARWNLPDGQANIFNYTGAGVSRFKGDNHATGWTGLLADYETRRIFTSYEMRLMAVDRVETSVWQRARVGIAPYLANADDLSTWVMFQVDHHPEKDREVVFTPLLRFFYKTTLIEAGASTNKDVMVNWIEQF